jgi:hypothetical protein
MAHQPLDRTPAIDSNTCHSLNNSHPDNVLLNGITAATRDPRCGTRGPGPDLGRAGNPVSS